MVLQEQTPPKERTVRLYKSGKELPPAMPCMGYSKAGGTMEALDRLYTSYGTGGSNKPMKTGL